MKPAAAMRVVMRWYASGVAVSPCEKSTSGNTPLAGAASTPPGAWAGYQTTVRSGRLPPRFRSSWREPTAKVWLGARLAGAAAATAPPGASTVALGVGLAVSPVGVGLASSKALPERVGRISASGLALDGGGGMHPANARVVESAIIVA